jgi:monoterpene epsilon-lactone hydrolase
MKKYHNKANGEPIKHQDVVVTHSSMGTYSNKIGSKRSRPATALMAAAALVIAGGVFSRSDASMKEEKLLNDDGSLNIASFTLPFSEYASPEAKAEQAGRLGRLAETQARQQGGLPTAEPGAPDILHKPWFEAQWKRYPATMTSEKIAGVDVQIFQPKTGVARENSRRVIINLHGGAFLYGWPFGSQIESLPIASEGKIKVVSVNYRMAPAHKFPAASEDVAAVYRELLKSHKPSEIGIYGCSAGGILAGEAVAWFDKVGLPQPAGVAIVSATLSPGFGGDSAYLTPRMGGYFPVPDPSKEPRIPYFTKADLADPLAFPGNSPALLAKFPPTLLATGTRAGDMSATVKSHMDLVSAGVEAKLYLWDGLEHCFLYNPEMPESRQAYKLINKFFADAMNRKSK